MLRYYSEDDFLNKKSKHTESSDMDKEAKRSEREELCRQKQNVYYVHLKGQISSLFANEEMREGLRYGTSYVCTEGVYQDVFDGAIIKQVTKDDYKTVSRLEHVIYIGLMQDGFTSKLFYNKSWSFTLFQVVCYSLSPTIRYKNGNRFQLFVSPGPKKPDLSSYVRPVAEELEELQKGFKVQVGDCTYNVVVKTLCVLGDSPAVSEIFCIKNSASYFSCRFCLAIATQKSEHMCPLAYV